jgi:hypothetical protein
MARIADRSMRKKRGGFFKDSPFLTLSNSESSKETPCFPHHAEAMQGKSDHQKSAFGDRASTDASSGKQGLCHQSVAGQASGSLPIQSPSR